MRSFLSKTSEAMCEVEGISTITDVHGVDYDPFAPGARLELISIPGQLEMWLSERAGVEARCALNTSLSVYLKGSVDEQALIRALQTLADFHGALRGHFSADGTRFIVEPSMNVPIANHDLTELSPAERIPAVQRLTELDAKTPYNLEKGPLFRASVIKVDSNGRVILLGVHRTVCDGWSLDVILEDFGRLYSAFAGFTALPLPPAHSFSDYVSYRGTPEYSAKVAASRSYWRTILDVLPPPLALLHQGQRPAQRTYGALYSLHRVSANVFESAKTLSRAQTISFYSVLCSAFAAIIHRLAGSSDFVMGVPIAGHLDSGMEECVGPLVNVVPLRFHVDKPQPFLELCRVTNKSMLNARENAAVGFGELVADLGGSSDPSGVPLITAVFTHVRKYAPGKLVFGDCSVDYQFNRRAFERFEINLDAFESHDGLVFRAHANSDLYTNEWLARLLRQLECLLRDACSSPHKAIGMLALLPREENVHISDNINDTCCKSERELPFANFDDEQIGALITNRVAETLPVGKPAERATSKVTIEEPIVVTLQPGRRDKSPLLCLFGIQLYVDVAQAINDGTPVVGIHVPIKYVPSRTPRPPLSEVAGYYCDVVRRVCPSGPYRLAGLCFGGVTAYEVGRLLQQQGEEVSLVVLFDSVLPNGHHIDQIARFGDYARNLKRTTRKALAKSAYASELLWSRLRGTASSDESEDAPVDLPVATPDATADVAKFEASKPYVDAHLLAFRASRPDLPFWDIVHSDMGWNGFARSLQFCAIPSNHLGIVRPPHAKRVAEVIMRELVRTQP